MLEPWSLLTFLEYRPFLLVPKVFRDYIFSTDKPFALTKSKL